MNTPFSVNEGTVSWRPAGLGREYRTWYRTVSPPAGAGKPGQLPLLCLHGGPGALHDYLEPLEALAASRCVIFYDQLGCGNSDVPDDPAIYTVDLFVQEIDAVRCALGLDRLHVLGHSWGGMLALEYALTQPAGLQSLILADTAASAPALVAEMRRLIGEMEPEAQSAIAEHEAAGTTNSPEYLAACRAFYARHGGGRIRPEPDSFRRMADKPGDAVYARMWGPSEFTVTGTLVGWDVSARLGEISLPSLVLGGRHDHATPALTQALHQGIAGSEWVIFEESGHFAHLEETERFLQVAGDFLARGQAPEK